MVVGDVTSTMACSIVARKMGINVAHVEAGIRSGDWSMPEEINRVVTDSLTNLFFTTSKTANKHLIKSGVKKSSIFFVGNTMIDTLLKQMHRLKKPLVWDEFGLEEGQYIVLTLHRPANVDEESKLKTIIFEIANCASSLPVVFPVHPRTASVLQKLGIVVPNLCIIDPLGYLEFNYLVNMPKPS